MLLLIFVGLTRWVPLEGSKLRSSRSRRNTEIRREPQGLQPRSWLSVGATCDVTFFVRNKKSHCYDTHNGLDSIATHPQKLPGILKKHILQYKLIKIRLFPLTHHFIFSKFIQCPGRSTSVTSAKTTYKTQILWDGFLGIFRAPGHQNPRSSKEHKIQIQSQLAKIHGNLRGSTHPTFPKN